MDFRQPRLRRNFGRFLLLDPSEAKSGASYCSLVWFASPSWPPVPTFYHLTAKPESAGFDEAGVGLRAGDSVPPRWASRSSPSNSDNLVQDTVHRSNSYISAAFLSASILALQTDPLFCKSSGKQPGAPSFSPPPATMGFPEQHMSRRIQLIQTRATQCERELQDINSAHRDYEASVARINNRLKESWEKLNAKNGTEDCRAIQNSIVGYGGELERLRSHYEADFENAAEAYKSRIDAAWTKFRQGVNTALSISLSANLTQVSLTGVAEQCTPTSPSYGKHLGLEAALPSHAHERACPSADCDENVSEIYRSS